MLKDVNEVVCNEASDFLAPEDNLLLLKVATILLVNKDQVERVAAGEAIINIVVSGRKISWRQVESYRDELAFDWGAIHDLKLA